MFHNQDASFAISRNIFSTGYRLLGCFISGTLAFLAPVHIVLMAAYGFILIDAVLGYSVSRKYGKKKFESAKAWRTVTKLSEATLLIIGAFIIDSYVVPSIHMHLVEIVAGAICFSEFWSWIEAFSDLRPNSRMSVILRKVVKSKGEKYLEIKFDDDDFKDVDNGNTSKDNIRNKR